MTYLELILHIKENSQGYSNSRLERVEQALTVLNIFPKHEMVDLTLINTTEPVFKFISTEYARLNCPEPTQEFILQLNKVDRL